MFPYEEPYRQEKIPTSFILEAYTSWKAKLHKFFKHYKGEKAPKEFVQGGRMDEWNWLKQHLLSPQFQKLSTANLANRDKLTMHHHAGCTAFIYNADKLRREGESLYLINGFEVAHDTPHNEIAAEKANDMRQKILTMLSEQHLDTPEDELLQQVDFRSQVDAFEKRLCNCESVLEYGFAGGSNLRASSGLHEGMDSADPGVDGQGPTRALLHKLMGGVVGAK
ncbi:hypothetical protein ACLB2K_045787 [Fragaria x ananassa]